MFWAMIRPLILAVEPIGDQAGFSRDGAMDHGAVSSGVNVGIVGLTRLIGQQGSFYHFQARAIQEGGIGPDTGAEDHQVCLIGFPVSQNFF